MQFAEFSECREQRVDGAFVYAERKLAALEALEFGKPLLYFITQVQEPLSVFAEQCAGIGQANRASAADKERLAERVFQFPYCQADGGLGAVEALRSPRKAAFLRHHEENLEFAEIHRDCSLGQV